MISDAPAIAWLVVKVTLVLAAGAGCARMVRSRNAATRHAIWAATLAAVLLLPLLGASLPAWSVPLPAALQRLSPPGEPLSGAGVPAAGTIRQSEASAVVARTAAASSIAEAAAPPATAVVRLAVVGWLSGSGIALLVIVAAQVRMRRLVRRSDGAPHSAWAAALAWGMAHLGIRHRVRILEVPGFDIPAAWGAWQPVVLVPAGSAAWGEGRKRAVVLHELAHVRRGDCLMEYLALAACAAWWFHPMVWYAARRLRAERERACDDLVLTAGTSAADYAGHLVDVAEFAAHARLTRAAVAFASPGTLESRLRDLLDPSRARGALRAPVRGALASVALVVVPTLAAVTPRPAPLAGSTGPGVVAAGRADTVQAALLPDVPLTWSGTAAAGDTVSIRVAMGNVVVEPGDRSVVEVRAVRRVGPRGVGRDTRMAAISRERALTICSVHMRPAGPVAPCEINDSWGQGSVDDDEVAFHLRIPAGLHLKVMTGLGDVSVSGIDGDVEVLTGNGEAVVEATGAATIDAFSGSIRYTPGITEAHRPAVLRVRHGAISILVPRGALVNVDARTDRGVVYTDRPLTTPARGRPISARLEKGDIRISALNR